VPPDGFLQGLRELCDRHGILLILDEVQTGIGRTGRMFACEHWGVEPDILTLAKGLGSGMPIGVMLARRRLMQAWPRGAHGNTFGGNPICCAAALATLDLVEREYAANAARVGGMFLARLQQMQAGHVEIGDVRGKGLFLGVELVKDRLSKEPAGPFCEAVVRQSFQNGLLLLPCGVSTIRFMPPLMASSADVDEAMTILDASLDEVRLHGAAG
jgi:4-aminobutyrate aminotransferase